MALPDRTFRIEWIEFRAFEQTAAVDTRVALQFRPAHLRHLEARCLARQLYGTEPALQYTLGRRTCPAPMQFRGSMDLETLVALNELANKESPSGDLAA